MYNSNSIGIEMKIFLPLIIKSHQAMKHSLDYPDGSSAQGWMFSIDWQSQAVVA